MAQRHDAKPLFDVAVGDIDTALVIKVIEPEWKRAPLAYVISTKSTYWSQNNKPTIAQWDQSFSLRETL
jgi:hypothetical protein